MLDQVKMMLLKLVMRTSFVRLVKRYTVVMVNSLINDQAHQINTWKKSKRPTPLSESKLAPSTYVPTTNYMRKPYVWKDKANLRRHLRSAR